MVLKNAAELERSEVVANARMNRDRSAVGVNSYARELRFSPIDYLQQQCVRRGSASWLDLCCGTGRALLETAADGQFTGNLQLAGVDLIDNFHAVPPNCSWLQLVCASLHTWTPNQQFDLITCVHGLHYVGDKLGLIERSASWLTGEGLLVLRHS